MKAIADIGGFRKEIEIYGLPETLDIAIIKPLDFLVTAANNPTPEKNGMIRVTLFFYGFKKDIPIYKLRQ